MDTAHLSFAPRLYWEKGEMTFAMKEYRKLYFQATFSPLCWSKGCAKSATSSIQGQGKATGMQEQEMRHVLQTQWQHQLLILLQVLAHSQFCFQQHCTVL